MLALQEDVKAVYEEWKQLDAKEKEPYERAALADISNRQPQV